MDDEEEVRITLSVEPMLHNRWSLLVFAFGAMTEVAEVVANNFSTLTLMSAQHAKQKLYDKRFKEITK